MKAIIHVLVLLAAVLPVAAGKSAQGFTRRVYVTVLDDAGNPVMDLSPAEFEVVEAGKKVTVVRASRVTEPMRIALLVDTSEEAKSALAPIRGGLRALLEAIPPQDEVLLVSTGGQARVRVPPTLDRKRLLTAADGLFAEGGSAVLLDAMLESWSRFLRNVEDRWPVIIAVGTSGPDSSSTNDPKLVAFIDEVQKAAANVHVFMLNTTQRVGTSSGFTSVMAAMNITTYSSGHYEALAASTALPEKMKKLGQQIAAQQQRFASQYEVDFLSESTDPQARIGVYVSRKVPGIALSMSRAID